jgi:hypothetical protein
MNVLKQKAIFMCFVIVFSIFSIYNVNAQENNVCCEATKSGERCVNTDITNCDGQFSVSQSSCSETTFCKPVCCSTDEGCFPGSSFSRCVGLNGQSFEDETCNSVNVCEQGCCKLGNQCSLTTEDECKQLASPYPGLRDNDNWLENVDDESACLSVCEAQDVGCCVDEGVCDYTARELCNGEFKQGELCSSLALCGCESRSYKACKDGDVYWFDSCDNAEEVAEQCDISQETICGEVDGNVQCKSINCEETYSDERNVHDDRIGGARKHGEAWCLYESPTGNYTDYPGSRHYVSSCLYGEEVTQPCRDLREEVCVSKEENINGEKFSYASCIDNNIYDSVVNVDVSTVASGQEFWEVDERDNDYCNDGNTECTVVWAKKNRFDDWDCEQNCECEKPEWIAQANLFCKAQGDCGADYNIAGEWSDKGLVVSWEGTHRGPRPRKITPELAEQWKIYGVYGGMEKLYDSIEEFVLEASTSGIPSEYGTASTVSLALGTAGVGFGVAAALAAEGSTLAGLAFGPVGWIVVGVLLFLGFILGGGKTATKTISVECNSWQAPRGGNNCELCTEEFLDCDKYKCKSLGAACEFVNEGTTEESCVNVHPNDPVSPVISPWNAILSEGYEIQQGSLGYRINPDIEPFEILTFGIKTDEPAECKISNEHSESFDDMLDYFEDSLMRTEHKRTLVYQGGKSYRFYVRCQDVIGNSNIAEYEISFTTKNEPDITPPRIVRTSIDNGAGIMYDVSETVLEVYVNEPAECKYGKEDMPFNSMPINNTGICNTEISEDGIIDAENACVFALDDIKNDQDNVWYFRCKDVAGNANQDSYKFTLKGTSLLTIDSKGPNGELYTNNPSLEVKTKGGMDNGKAVCNFKFGEFAETQFLNTGGNVHSQQLQNMALGFYKFGIRCIDDAGNMIEDFIEFNVAVDSSGPRINYIYKDSSNLHVVMSEKSSCEYNALPFTFGQGSKMTGEGTKAHSLPLNEKRYYIICEDINKNIGEQFIIYP